MWRFLYILLLLSLLSLSACEYWAKVDVYELPSPYTIEVKGEEYEWHIRYPGRDGQLHTDDDVSTQQHIHLPENTKVNITINSSDYLYFLELPDFRQIGMAVPEMEHFIEITTKTAGEFKIRGDQMCGYTHESLYGILTVESPRRFHRWLAQQH